MAERDLELPADSESLQRAVNAAAEGGRVVLRRGGKPVVAIVPYDVAAAGFAALDGADDATDLRLAERLVGELRAGMATTPLVELRRELAASSR